MPLSAGLWHNPPRAGFLELGALQGPLCAVVSLVRLLPSVL